MGVPAFYRWLSEKYPKIVKDMLEKRNAVVDGVEIPLNLDEPNPNGLEYDNLYIDLNGLIHPCSHPEDREAPSTEAEMYLNVTKYIDRLFAACRPRRLLFLAIDGVAPRAKMNQQRARRFRAAQEARERVEMMEEVVAEMTALGLALPPASGAAWDSNVITPGTEFMSHLSLYLWYYVLDRMNRIPSWRNVKVILSDASEPGEGEHKIMKFIRAQRSQPGYDPNQRHILHGLDADLIMLALATHELHFTILREEVTFGRNKDRVKSEAQRLLDLESAAISALHPHDEWVYGKALQCLHVGILREYLYFEFRVLETTLPFAFDLERIIDDFVFVCFFVGNDFLPHLPSLDIRDGALDFLIEVYKDMLPSMGEYVTSPGGNVNLRQLDVLLSKVGEVEDKVFQTRKAAEDKEQYKRGKQSQYSKVNSGQNVRENLLSRGDPRAHLKALGRSDDTRNVTIVETKSTSDNVKAASAIKNLLQKKSAEDDVISIDKKVVGDQSGDEQEFQVESSKRKQDYISNDSMEKKLKGEHSSDVSSGKTVTTAKALDKKALADKVKNKLKQKEQKIIEGNKDTVVDTVKFHEYGWKARYYEDNYKKEDIAANGGLKNMCRSYIEGLCWVLKYYYQGCPSWNWYYPFHYAPFASDLVNVDSYDIKFELSKPFKPVEQLLAVLPSHSVSALPEGCGWLMLDDDSPIKDLYSDDIPIDPNGKILPWLWVVLLPFIDENRITSAMDLCLDNLSEEEKKRNSYGTPVVFVHKEHALGKVMADRVVPDATTHSFTAEEGQGIQGNMAINSDENLIAEIGGRIAAPLRPLGAFNDIRCNDVLCYRYEYPLELTHISRLLDGAVPDDAALSEYDGMPRRPPRLNKGGFNIVDMARNMKKDQQSENGSYSHVVGGQNFHQSSFFESHSQRNFNHRNDGGYGGESDYNRNYNQSYGGYKGGKGNGRYGTDSNFEYSGGGNNFQNRDNMYTTSGGKGGQYRGGSMSGGYENDRNGKGYSRRGDSYDSSGRGGGKGYNRDSNYGGGKGGSQIRDNRVYDHGGSGGKGFTHRAPPSRNDYFSQPPPSFMHNSNSRTDFKSGSSHQRNGPPSYPNQFSQFQQSYSHRRESLSANTSAYASRAPPPPTFANSTSSRDNGSHDQTSDGKGRNRDPRRR